MNCRPLWFQPRPLSYFWQGKTDRREEHLTRGQPVAGNNHILKEGMVLFREGDQSDGMYVVRQGEVLIYLEKGGQEVKLAKVTGGAMIGEMALFDQKPRSASAKATKQTEVTKISNDDFKKILKQIPKWFVALMTTLSTRLRETNERLQKVESKTSGHKKPLEDVNKIIGVLSLIWHRDGTKEGKAWVLEREPAQEEIAKILDLELSVVKGVIDAFLKANLLVAKPNSYKKDVLHVANKGHLERFLEFTSHFTKTTPGEKSLSDTANEMLQTLLTIAQNSAYESVTVSLEDLCTEGERASIDTSKWKDELGKMKNLGEACKLVKVSNGIGFKIVKKDLPKVVEQYRVLQILNQSGVS